jgi:nicotinamide-nucleotide amidase
MSRAGRSEALIARRAARGGVRPSEAARILGLAADLGARLMAKRLVLAAAESCTGGGVGFAVTQIAGSSAWFDRGFVAYSNSAKQQMLGVPAATLGEHGAVSEATARAMALGALARSSAQVAVAVTGVAGPGGGSPEKPVGTVWFAWALRHAGSMELLLVAQRYRLRGDRAAVRSRAIVIALDGLVRLLDGRLTSE